MSPTTCPTNNESEFSCHRLLANFVVKKKERKKERIVCRGW